ncbi:MAG: amidase domain-containing protein [Bacillota bacterium]
MPGRTFFLAVLAFILVAGIVLFFSVMENLPSSGRLKTTETHLKKFTAEEKEKDIPSAESLLPRLREIYETRAGALLTEADPERIVPLYDREAGLGRWALSHEQTKIAYVQNWAKKRGVRIVEAKVSLDVKWSRVQKDAAEFNIWQTLILGYRYPDQEDLVNHFGIGTRHSVKLVKKNKWLIQRDWYTDPLGDDTLVPKPVPADGSADLKITFSTSKNAGAPSSGNLIYDRVSAVRYADKYAGLAVIQGERIYNPRYRDLNGRGGDCTNFVSQVLGDKEGGKLPMDSVWHYRYDARGGSGSTAWVQTDSFAHWLLYGGRATRLARGTFPEVALPEPKFPQGAVRELQKGDLIAYEEKHDIQHFAVVTGFDSKGYPLVNAHTADRYHCPWDIGWDRTTIFHLFCIKDS